MEGPRACTAEDFEETMALLNSIFRAGSDQRLQTDYPLIFRPSRFEYMRIIKEDGKVVAHVPVAPREVIVNDDRLTVGIISPTGTHPDYRHRGHGTRCLRDCLRIMNENDWPVSVLWTREATFPFYQNSGYEAVGQQARGYLLNPSDYEVFRRGAYDISLYNPNNPDHLDSIIEIHEAEPLRIGRTREEYEHLLNLHKMSTLLTEDNGRIVAYLAVTRANNKPGIVEGGGEAGALEALYHQALLLRGNDDSAHAVAPLNPTSFGDVLEARKPGTSVLDTESDIGFQMMRVNSLPSLISKITGHLRERSAGGVEGTVCLVCKDDGDAVTITLRNGDVGVSTERSGEPVELTRRQLTKLIFGPHPAADPITADGEAGEMLDAIFPVYFPVWELDHS